MKDKIWSESDLRKRDAIAANAAQAIATTKHPRQYLNFYIRDLIKYEILPNIVWKDMSDQEIRKFAKCRISPPERLSKAARFDHFNKFPSLSIEQCIMLLIDVEPGTPIRTRGEKDRHDSVIKLAASYCTDRREPFANDHIGHIRNYQISPYLFVEWVKAIGEEPPKEWKPIKPKATQKKTDTIALPQRRQYEDDTQVSVFNDDKERPTGKLGKPTKADRVRQINELRGAAVSEAIRLKCDGLSDKYITVSKICRNLLDKGRFSTGEPFNSRWRTENGMKSLLKGEYHPKASQSFKSAQRTKTKFNP